MIQTQSAKMITKRTTIALERTPMAIHCRRSLAKLSTFAIFRMVASNFVSACSISAGIKTIQKCDLEHLTCKITSKFVKHYGLLIKFASYRT